MTQAASLATLAVVLLVAPGPVVSRTRLTSLLRHDPPAPHRPRREWAPVLVAGTVGLLVASLVTGTTGVLIGCASTATCLIAWRRHSRRASRLAPSDPLRLAAGWDLLAASLAAGLPVPAAVRATTTSLPPPAAAVLRRVGELLALGADPVAAWTPALDHTDTAQLARAARRTARSGSALADVARQLATELRAEARDTAEARAQRAGVLITGPLGLCFLPAFLCLGVVPVVLGLAHRLIDTW
ncbi:type II secretion system F family protein [Streptoalloteichus tenebrarius]|nr:type II secretion system F family protein [Streptoalloteichus tenebrarius]